VQHVGAVHVLQPTQHLQRLWQVRQSCMWACVAADSHMSGPDMCPGVRVWSHPYQSKHMLRCNPGPSTVHHQVICVPAVVTQIWTLCFSNTITSPALVTW
jgi:hypothetical protein